ncbi:hypothetical protein H8356DRAFT_1424997 [Neocallimastix lanati (nom. inval.)]|nr:hypothetical protein H8356DRAFT_1424997 [Neocallimastix sp. JGI-2020a]
MQLCERIKYNITMKSYAGEWDNNNEDTNSNRSDDPMEIDAISDDPMEIDAMMRNNEIYYF